MEEENISANNLKSYNILFADIVNFADFGVPQNRERLIIIGIREDVAEKISKNLNKIKEKIKNKLVKQNFSPLTPIEMFEGKIINELDDYYESIMKEYENIVKSVDSKRASEYRSEDWPEYTFNILKDYVNLNSISKTEITNKILKKHKNPLLEVGAYNNPINIEKRYEDGTNKDSNTSKNVIERMKRIPPGENHTFVKGTDYSVRGLMSNIYRRVHPLVPSPTIIANGGGGTWGYHYKQNRQSLTNRERARLQTFPDTFKFYGNKSDVRRQIGNSVPPVASKKIAGIVKEILEEVSLESNTKEQIANIV